MILLIDNYDSFVYNLKCYLSLLGYQVVISRNDEISLSGVAALNPSHVVLSPGPCGPDKAGICLELVDKFYQSVPILGVCLGHQVIAQAFGAKICKALEPKHGIPSEITHFGSSIFSGLESSFNAARYHSLVADKATLPDCLELIAESKDGEVMGIAHRQYPVYGLQFHPESILTARGLTILGNFLSLN